MTLVINTSSKRKKKKPPKKKQPKTKPKKKTSTLKGIKEAGLKQHDILPCCLVGFFNILINLHTIIEWFRLEWTFKDHRLQAPCHRHGHHSLDQSAQSTIFWINQPTNSLYICRSIKPISLLFSGNLCCGGSYQRPYRHPDRWHP